MFPDWNSLERHREVLRFACSLSNEVAIFLCYHQHLYTACRLSSRVLRVCFEILAENTPSSKALYDRLFPHTDKNNPGDRDIESLGKDLLCQTYLGFHGECISGLMKILTEFESSHHCWQTASTGGSQTEQQQPEWHVG